MLAVLVFHAGHLRGGYLGVDLFFVLSGFLITRLLLDESARTGRVSLGHFWERRARRLLPALGVMLVGVAAYARFVAAPESLRRLRLDGLATVFYVANWRAVFGHVDYWALFTSPSPLEHTWSLAIEEQFYVLWPLLFSAVAALVFRRARRAGREVPDPGVAVLVTALVGAAVSALWALSLADGGVNRVYYGTDTRAVAILAGAALAAAVHRWGYPQARVAKVGLQLLGVAGGLFLAVAWVRLDGTSPRLLHGGLIACSLAATALIAAVTAPGDGLLARAVGFVPLRWLGLVSYGVYLYHWPLYVWLDEQRVGRGGWVLVVVRLVATFVVAVLSYKFVEQPIRHGRSARRVPKVVIPACGAACVALLVVASTAGYEVGPRSLFTTASLKQAIAQAEQRGGPRLLIVGNSVGWDMAHEGFSKLTSDPQLTSFNLAEIGCEYPDNEGLDPSGPEPVISTKSCRTHWFDVAEQFRPDYVIFIRNGVSISTFIHDGKRLSACSADYRSWLADSFVDDADRFADFGSKLVLVTSPFSIHLPAPGFDWDAYTKTVTCGNDAMRAAAKRAPDHIEIVDLAGYLCVPSGECRNMEDGVTLRKDGTHFKDEAAVLISKWILSKLGIRAAG